MEADKPMNQLPQRTWNPIPKSKPKPKKKSFGIRKVSPKMAKLKREYNRLRIQFLLDHPFCQHYIVEKYGWDRLKETESSLISSQFAYKSFPRSSEIHHRLGRGKYLLDTCTWMAVRSGHATYIHLDPKRYEKGYMLKR